MSTLLPLLIEADELEKQLHHPDILIIDVGKASTYQNYHIPGAIHLPYTSLLHAQPPVMGLLPSKEELATLFSQLGIDEKKHVIAYDDEGGGCACRLLWTLEVMGHTQYSLLNGGLHTWANEQHPLSHTPHLPQARTFITHYNLQAIADKSYIQDHLNDPDVVLLDARSSMEFQGIKKFSQQAGHIPGAVNIDWSSTMDQQKNLRFQAPKVITMRLHNAGITPDKTIVTYCQTHHRSSHSYMMLKILGYPDIKGYPGSWSDWGNDSRLPVASS